MEKRVRSIFPLLLLIAVNLIGMWTLMNNGNVNENMIVMCVGMCVLSFVVYLLINLCDMGDPYLFLIATMLATIGIMVVTSLSPTFGADNMKMYIIGVAMFFITILMYRLFYRLLKKFTVIYFGLSVALYILTLVLAKVQNGAKNWIKLGEGLSVQPSEFIKVLFVMTIAGILTYAVKGDYAESVAAKRYTSTLAKKSEKKPLVSQQMIAVTVVTYVNLAFLFAQTELGTAIILFAIYLAFLFVYDESKLLLFVNTAVLALVIIVAVTMPDILPDYLNTRINGWLTPFETRDAGGNYIVKSLVAIYQGNFTGVGIGNGNINLEIFETVISDYVFSAVCKEMGILGGIGVIMLYFVLVYRGFKIAVSTTNEFNKALAFGLSTMLGVQIFIIIGGVTRLIPLTGITLPFVSHGGSSMFSTFIAIGILQAISSVKGDTTDEIE